jgi:hypothetical protein
MRALSSLMRITPDRPASVERLGPTNERTDERRSHGQAGLPRSSEPDAERRLQERTATGVCAEPEVRLDPK